MKLVKIVIQIGILSVFYLMGLGIQQLFHLFIPGSIIGMLLLFLALLTKFVKEEWIDKGANLIISHFPLLFIPVTVGFMNYFHVFTGKGLLLIPIGLCITIIVIITSGLTSQHIAKRRMKKYE
jgi:holin-like protein